MKLEKNNYKRIFFSIFILIVMMLISNFVLPSETYAATTDMVTVWDVPAGFLIGLPVKSSDTTSLNININWGDGTTSSGVTTNFPGHTYTTAGTYTITISGTCPIWGYTGTNEITNTSNAYYAVTNYLTEVKQLGQLNTERYSFSLCKKLTKVTGAVTSNTFAKTTSMRIMFNDCTSLTSVDLKDGNAIKVTDFSGMFQKCTALETINLSGFKTSTAATDMSYMFSSCSLLKNLDLSGFNTSNVTTMLSMFIKCSGLTGLDLSSFNTSNVTTMQSMFYECGALESVNLNSFNTSSVTTMYAMFYNCISLTDLDLSTFNTSLVENMEFMFRGCTNLAEIIINKDTFKTGSVTSMKAMFAACSSLESFEVSGFDTSSVTSMYQMFHTCSKLKELDVSNFKGTSVTTIRSMFYYCSSLEEIDLSNFNTPVLTDMSEMFNTCSSLKNLKLGGLNTSGVTTMAYTFKGCTSLEYLDLNNFDTTAVTDMTKTFYKCTSLKSMQVGNKFVIPATHTDSTDGITIFTNVPNLSSIIIIDETPTAGAFTNVKSILTENTIFYVPNETAETAYQNSWSADYSEDRIEPILWIETEDQILSVGDAYTDTTDIKVAGFDESVSGDYTCYGYNVQKTGDVDTRTSGIYPREYTVTRTYTNGNTETTDEVMSKTRNIIVKEPMITKWNIPANTTITLPVAGAGSSNTSWTNTDLNITVDWGDGTVEQITTANPTHEYTVADTYTITVSGTCPMWGYYGSIRPTTSRYAKYYTYTQYLVGIERFGELDATRYGFSQCRNLEYVSGDNLVTENTFKKVTDMSYMFYYVGYSATTFSLDLSSWDTGVVTNMNHMFYSAGYSATTFSLDLSGWNTGAVTNMRYMFNYAGYSATTWSIGGLSGWDTGAVTGMSQMFYYAGYSATTFNLDLSSWDTGVVTNMNHMFWYAGYSATTWSIGDLSSWDTGAVTDMSSMFGSAGYSATTWSIGDLSGWDTGAVTGMNEMFSSAGYSATTFSIDLSSWDTGAVTNMDSMFYHAGKNATTWTIGDLSGWETSKVTNMGYMFLCAGENATTWNIGDLSGWDTRALTKMSYMFYRAGYNSTPFALDLSGFNTSNVTNMTDVFYEMRKLSEITLGEKFTFNGSGDTRKTNLPTPSSAYITGADGKWYNLATKVGYAPADVPNNTAATYTAVNPISGDINITGEATIGKTLAANTSNIIPTECTFAYQWWYADSASATSGTNISGETNSTYTIGSDVLGKYIGVTVNANLGTNISKTFTDITDASHNTTAKVSEAPMDAPQISAKVGDYVLASDTWSSGDITLSITGSGAASGREIAYKYSYNGTTWNNYTGAVTYSTETSGAHFYARAYIVAEPTIESTIAEFIIKLDKTAPVIESITTIPTQDIWTSGTVTVQAKVSDDNSGVIKSTFYTGMLPEPQYSSYYAYLDEPLYDGYISKVINTPYANRKMYVIDQAGNYANKACEVTNIDRTAPIYYYTEGHTKEEYYANIDKGVTAYTRDGKTSDPMFKNGKNGISGYTPKPVSDPQNNFITITRPTYEEEGLEPYEGIDSEYVLKIKSVGMNTSSGQSIGGFAKSLYSYADGKFIHKFIAKIPVGYEIGYRNNSITGSFTWITTKVGTGEWQEYAYMLDCSSRGSFDTFGYITLLAKEGAIGTEENPIIWYLGYTDIIDVTNIFLKNGINYEYVDGNILLDISATDTQSGVETIKLNGTNLSLTIDGSIATAQTTLTAAGKYNLVATDYVSNSSTETLNVYEITYDSNNGANATSKQLFISGVETNVKENTYEYSDNYFLKWNTKADGTGKSYIPGDKITITENTTLYAIWKMVNVEKKMITEWKIPTAGTKITLPVSGTGLDVMIDWGDGNLLENWTDTTKFPTHTYAEAGIYKIVVMDTCPIFGYVGADVPASGTDYYTYTQYLTKVVQWGEINATRFGFSNCTNLESVAGTYPENTFTNVSDISYMFNNCSKLTGSPLIPSNITAIGEKAYYNCSEFTGNVILANTITSIGSSAFSKCSGLDYVLLPTLSPVQVTNASTRSFEDVKVYALTEELATLYNAYSNWNLENDGNGVYKALELVKTEVEKINANSTYVDTGATTVAGFSEDPNGTLKTRTTYTNSSGTTTATLNTSKPDKYTINYILQMKNAAGKYEDVNNSIGLEKVSRQIIVIGDGHVTLNKTNEEILYKTASKDFTVTSHHGGALSVKETTETSAEVAINGTTITISNLEELISGTKVTIRVTSSATEIYREAYTDYTLTVVDAVMKGSIKITGKAQYNQTLSVNTADVEPIGCSFTYQWWYSDSPDATSGEVISSATGSTYKVGAGLVGKYIGVTVNASKANYENGIFTDVTDSSNTSATVIRADGYINLSATSGTSKYGVASKELTVTSHHGGNITATETTETAAETAVNGTTVTITNIESIESEKTVTISVTSEATADYNAASKSYTLTIIDAEITGNVTITGTAQYSKTLTVDTSAIRPTGCSFTYQWWYANTADATSGEAISGATRANYRVGSGLVGKYIGVTVTAKKTNYEETIFTDIIDAGNNTNATVVKADGYINMEMGSDISYGAPLHMGEMFSNMWTPLHHGGELSAEDLNNTGAVISISGTSESVSYSISNISTLPSGTEIKVKVTSAATEDYTEASKVFTFTIVNANMSGSVKITGTTKYLEKLTVDTSGINPEGTNLTYQWWYAETADATTGEIIEGETNASYVVGPGLAGKYIGVTVNASKENYNSKEFTDITDEENNESATVMAAQGSVTVDITGTNKVEQTLRAVTETLSDGAKTYQWWYSTDANATTGTAINGAINSTYTVEEAMSGKYVGVTVNVANGSNYTECSASTKIYIEEANYKVNGIYYATLVDAYDAIEGATGEIVVARSNTDSSQFVVEGGKTITINTMGKTITKSVACIVNRGTLSIEGNGIIQTLEADENEVNRLIINENILNIQNGTILNKGHVSKYWYALYNTGTTNLYDGTLKTTLTEGTTVDCGARTVQVTANGVFNMHGGSIINEYDDSTDKTIALESDTTGTAEINILDGLIKSETSAIRLLDSSETGKCKTKLNISGGEIESGAAAIMVSESFEGTINITGGKITADDEGVKNTGTGKITIGVLDDTVSITSPEIIGGNYAIDSNNGFYFYDGVLKGGTKAFNGSKPDIEDTYEIQYGSETIGIKTYETAILVKANYIVNGNYYATLADAYNAIKATSGVILVNQSNEDPSELLIDNTKSITINTNGLKITLTGKRIQNKGTLIIDGGGIIEDSAAFESGSNKYILSNYGTLNINNVTLLKNSASTNTTLLYAWENSIVNINGGTILANGNGEMNYCIQMAANSTINMESGTIKAVTEVEGTGATKAVHMLGGTFNMKGGTIEVATTNAFSNIIQAVYVSGGGVFNLEEGTVKVTGARKSDTSKASSVIALSASTLNMYDGVLINEQLETANTLPYVINSSNSSNINIIDGEVKGLGYYALYLNGSSNKVKITGGTIEAKGRAIRGIGTTNDIVIGTSGDTVSQIIPILKGDASAIKVDDGGGFKFYDGILKGGGTSAFVGEVIATEADYGVKYGTEPIGGKTYQTAVLEKEISDVTLVKDSYVYDGEPKEPDVIVKWRGTPLTIDVDFSVTYSDNVDAGTAKVTVTGIGGYIGTVEKTFEIKPAPMSGSVTINGINRYGETLTVDTAAILPTGCSFTYQWWYADSASATSGNAINGATSSSYKIGKGLVGKYIGVTVTASKVNYVTTDFTDTTNEKIAAIIAELKWSADKFVYNTKDQTVTATVTNKLTGDTVTVTAYTGNVGQDAGSYTATATALSTDDYTLVGSTTAVHNWVIEKAPITPVITMQDYFFGGTKASPSISGNSGNGTFNYYVYSGDDLSTEINWNTVTSSVSLQPGTYKMYAKVDETKNYKAGTSAAVTFQVKIGNITVNLKANGAKYNNNWTNYDVVAEVILPAEVNTATQIAYREHGSNTWIKCGNVSQNKATYTFDDTYDNRVYFAVLNEDDVVLTKENGPHTIKIDKIKPVVGKVEQDPIATQKANSKDLVVSNVVELGGSGIYQYGVSTTANSADATWFDHTEDSFIYEVFENLTYYIFVKDYAGNISDVTANSQVTVEKIVPKVSNASIENELVVDVYGTLMTIIKYSGDPAEIIYSVVDESLATINSATGLITGDASGETEVIVSFRDYDNEITEVRKKLTVLPLDAHITVSPLEGFELTYDGVSKETVFSYDGNADINLITATSNNENVVKVNKVDGTRIIATPVNVGETTITIFAPHTPQYKATTLEIPVKVNPKVAVFKWTSGDFVYDGEMHSVTATIANLAEGDTQPILTYMNNEKINAGSYTAVVTSISNPNYTPDGGNSSYNWRIEQAERTIEVSDALELEFGESGEITYTYTGENTNVIVESTASSVASLEHQSATNRGTIIVTARGAGKCKAIISVPATLNYKAIEGECDITVIAADPYLKIDSPTTIEMNYGDGPSTYKYTYTGNSTRRVIMISDDSVVKAEVSGDELIITPLRANINKNVTLVLTAPATPEYNEVSTVVNILVKPKPVILEWVGDSFVYDGREKEVYANITNIVGSDNIDLSYSGNKESIVGNYVAEVTGIIGTDKDNYTLENGENITHNWEITKAEREISIQNEISLVYGEEGKVEFKYTGEDVDDIIVSIANPNVATVKYEDGEMKGTVILTPVGKGECNVTIYIPESDSFKDLTETFVVKVDRATPSLELSSDNLTFVYGDESKEISYNYNGTGGIDVTSSKTSVVTASVDTVAKVILINPGNAGTATLTFTTRETPQHSSISKTITVTVNPRPVDIKWGITSFKYDGNQKTVTATIRNLVNGDTVNLTYDGNKQTNIGTYSAKVTALSNSNYTLDGGLNISTAWEIKELLPVEITVRQDGQIIDSGTWASGDVTVTLEPVDWTGIDITYQYSYNEKDWVTYSGPFVINRESRNSMIYARAYNSVNGVALSLVGEYNLKFDKTDPSIRVSTIEATGKVNNTISKDSEVTVKLTIEDLLSGIDSDDFTIEDIKIMITDKGIVKEITDVTKELIADPANKDLEYGSYKYTLTFGGIKENGRIHLKINEKSIYDNALRYNQLTTINLNLNVDNEAPDVGIIETSGDSYGRIFGDEVGLNVEAKDDSGIESYEWQVSRDNNTWTTFELDETTLELSEVIYQATAEGEYYFRVIVSDIMGNKATSYPATVNVNLTMNRKPTIRFEINPQGNTVVKVKAIIKSTREIAKISINASELLPSMWEDNIVKVNNEITVTVDYVVTANGTYAWTVIDELGNTTTEKINITSIEEEDLIVVWKKYDVTEYAYAKIEFQGDQDMRIAEVKKPEGTKYEIIKGNECPGMIFNTTNFVRNVTVQLSSFSSGTIFVFENRGFAKTEVQINDKIDTQVLYIRIAKGLKTFDQLFGPTFNENNATPLVNKMLSTTKGVNGSVENYYGISSSSMSAHISKQEELMAASILATEMNTGSLLKINEYGDVEKLNATVNQKSITNNTSFENGNTTGIETFEDDILNWGSVADITFRITIRAR